VSAISEAFRTLRNEGRKGVIPYITAGYPSLEATHELLVILAEAGATAIEVGVPFSDPMADGPVIQRACEAALKRGVRLHDVLAVTREAQKKTGVPLVLFSYLNPLLQYGLEKLVRDAAASGIAGVLVTDIPADGATRFAALLRQNNMDLISLIAPTSSDERLRRIAATAGGFLYAISRNGVTGTREEMSGDARELVRRTRQFTDMPVAVGFGISTPQHALEAWEFADAVIVGSAIVREIEEAGEAKAAHRAAALVRRFVEARQTAPSIKEQ